MALSDIVARIDADARSEAAAIVSAAKARAEAVLSQARAQAAEETEQSLALARRDAQREASTMVVGARLRVRDEGLAKRQELVSAAVEQLRMAVESMPDDRYAAFLARRIADAARGGETLQLGRDDQTRRDAIVGALAGAANGREIAVGDEQAPFARGALLVGERVRVDLALETIIDDERERLEQVAGSVLFAGGESSQ